MLEAKNTSVALPTLCVLECAAHAQAWGQVTRTEWAAQGKGEADWCDFSSRVQEFHGPFLPVKLITFLDRHNEQPNNSKQ